MNPIKNFFNELSAFNKTVNSIKNARRLLHCRKDKDFDNFLNKHFNKLPDNKKSSALQRSEIYLMEKFKKLVSPKDPRLELLVDKKQHTFLAFCNRVEKDLKKGEPENKGIKTIEQKAAILKKQLSFIHEEKQKLNDIKRPMFKKFVKVGEDNNLKGKSYLHRLYTIQEDDLNQSRKENQIAYADFLYYRTFCDVTEYFSFLNQCIPEAKETIINENEEDLVKNLKSTIKLNNKKQIKKTYNKLANIKKCSDGVLINYEEYPDNISLNEQIANKGEHIFFIYKEKGKNAHPLICEFATHLDTSLEPSEIPKETYAKAMYNTLEKINTAKKTVITPQLS